MDEYLTAARVMIVEPRSDGHRLAYVGLLLRYCARRHIEVILLTTNEVLRSPQYSVHLADNASETHQVIAYDDLTLKEVVSQSRKWSTHRVVIPDGDNWVQELLRCGGWHGSGTLCILIMRATAQGGKATTRVFRTAVKRTLLQMARLLPRCRIYYLTGFNSRDAWKKFTAPDPISYVPDHAAALRLDPALVQEEHTKWLGIVGAITKRKNVPLVLKAVEEVCYEKFGIIIAGKISPDVETEIITGLRRIERKGIPIVYKNAHLSDHELDGILDLLHGVVIAHSNEGPSGILGKSAAAGTYAVTAGAQSLKVDSKKIRGATWSRLKVNDLAQSIELVLRRPKLEPQTVSSTDVFCRRLIGDETGVVRR